MHNCKATRNSLIDLAFETNSARSDESAKLLSEVRACNVCRTEYASLCHTLAVVNQATRSADPDDSFWGGYHCRLSHRLKSTASTDLPVLLSQARNATRMWSMLRKVGGASVRIPVPVAAVVFLFFGLSMFLIQTRGRIKPGARATVTEMRTIEVPVIKEKVITRVVYVAKDRRFNPAQSQTKRTRLLTGTMAGLHKEPANKTALNLSGFKPTDQVKLTIIKGSYRYEK